MTFAFSTGGRITGRLFLSSGAKRPRHQRPKTWSARQPMKKPSGPTTLFACAAALAAIASMTTHDDAGFAQMMAQWAIGGGALAAAFYKVVDCDLARRSKK